jgi:hypothetical protein
LGLGDSLDDLTGGGGGANGSDEDEDPLSSVSDNLDSLLA